MSLAFAQCERPVTALLLGVGGAAMWRFLRAYVPECARPWSTTTRCCRNGKALVLPDPAVMLDSAERFLAATTTKYDVILVDLYNSHGPAEFGLRLLDAVPRCAGARRLPRTNWADFASNAKVRPMADAQAEVARARGLDCFYVTRRTVIGRQA